MKKLSYTGAILVLILAAALLSVTNPVFSFTSKVDSEKADTTWLRNYVVGLGSTSEPRCFEHPKGLNEACAYIINCLDSLGLQSEEQMFNVAGLPQKNIIVSFGPKDAERLIVGAHYDVCGEQAGADDNASGVAGLLELARLLKNKTDLKYRIDLVFYTLEEPPHFRTKEMGSYIHAKSLFDQKIKVKGMVCLEMIGYFSEKPKSQQYPIGILKLFYPTKANYIAVVSKIGQGRFLRKIKKRIKPCCDVDVKSINAPAWITGIDFSDHLNYWAFGYDAVMITDTSFYRNANYHEKTDTVETLDFAKMAEVVRGVYHAITTL